MGRNKTIQSAERTMILRVLHFFEEEKRLGLVIPADQALRRTCAATGVSLSTLTRIKREEKKILETLSLSLTPTSCPEEVSTSAQATRKPAVILPTPGRKRQPAHNKLEIDDFTICSLRRIMNSFHTERKEPPTLKKVLEIAKESFNFPGQKETLRKILKEKLGYEFKCSRKRNLLIERKTDEIVNKIQQEKVS